MGGFQEDGWVLVQRKRRGRDRQPPQQYGRRGWMASAPPTSKRRWVQSPPPNRPVPPPRTSRYYGPQSRSFADMVRQELRGPPRRFVSPRVDESDGIKRQAADPQFRRLARKLHAVVKIVHHLQNVAPKPGRQPPRMIAKMMDILSGMIRPASPTDKTMDLIKGNADNWGYSTQLILQDHYEDCLATLLEEVAALAVHDWKEQFHTAVRWARRNLPNVDQGSIDHAQALIIARLNGDNPPQPTRPADQPRATMETTSQGTDQAPPQPPQPPLPSRTESLITVAPPPIQAPPQPPQVDPQEQREPISRTRRGLVLTEDLFLDPAGGGWGDPPVTPRAHRSALEDLEDLFGSPGQARGGDPTDVMLPVSQDSSNTGGAQVQAPVLVHRTGGDREDSLLDSDQEDSRLTTGDKTSTPVRWQRPTRHANSERKMIDWKLHVSRKWLIVGDSNLSRIPSFDIPDLQIDAYPGANFRHAEALMCKATSSVTVEKVILSLGLNHKRQKAKETSVKQLQGAVRAARRKFPYAEIWIPQISFSSALSRDEKQTLRILNGYMERNLLSLAPLDEKDFHTERDNVHWTKATGRAMLAHWAALLNLTAL